MAVKLGYGGVANTNGARDFTGKAEAEVVVSTDGSGGPWLLMGRSGYMRMLILVIGGL